MNRRQYLAAAASTGAAALAGCTSQGDAEDTNARLTGIYVYAHPEAQDEAPFDATVTVDEDGERIYEHTSTITEPEEMEGFDVPADVLDSDAPKTVTVDTPLHDEPAVFDTTEYAERRIDDRYPDGECVFLRARIATFTIHLSPHSQHC